MTSSRTSLRVRPSPTRWATSWHSKGADGWGFAVLALAGLVCAAVAGLIKELLDGKPDWHDLLATVLGGLLPLLANTLGTLLCVLSGS